MAPTLPLLPAFDTEPINSAHRWKKYLQRFENLLAALDLKEDRRKKALLLHYSGRPVQAIFATFTGHVKLDYAQTVRALRRYFQPKKNITFKVYSFKDKIHNFGKNTDHHLCSCLKQLRKREKLTCSPYFEPYPYLGVSRNSCLRRDDRAINKSDLACCKRMKGEKDMEFQAKEREDKRNRQNYNHPRVPQVQEECTCLQNGP